jgi:hypothetical protein
MDPAERVHGSGRPLPLFPTRHKPAIFPPIVRLNSEACGMVGSNREAQPPRPTLAVAVAILALDPLANREGESLRPERSEHLLSY